MKRRTPMPRGTARLQRRTSLAQGESGLSRSTRLRPQSSKRQKENRERREMAKTLWPDGRPLCAVPWCTSVAADLHEPLTRARGGSITDPDNAEPLCRRHHDEVTFGEPAWAYELGLLIHEWDEKNLAVIAEHRRFLLHHGERPVEEWAFCAWCKSWQPVGHDCPYGQPSEPDDEDPEVAP